MDNLRVCPWALLFVCEILGPPLGSGGDGDWMMHLNETDKVNNLTKLARHRIAARAIALYPELIEHAKNALDRIEEQNGWSPSIDEWHDILEMDIFDIRRALTARTEEMDRLRIDSPFMLLREHGLDFTDTEERTRIWRLAKRVATISTRDEGWDRCSQDHQQPNAYR